MIRLFLKNYSDAECVALYNAFSVYMDCREDKKKAGVKQCPHV